MTRDRASKPPRPELRRVLALGLGLLLGLGAGALSGLPGARLARADDAPAAADPDLDKASREALAAVARAVFLVAADKGAPAPREQAMTWLPPELDAATASVAASPRAGDLRAADDPALRRSLLKNLIDETPDAVQAVGALTDGLGARLGRELADLDRRAVILETDSGKLLEAARAGRVTSTSAALAGKAPKGASAVLRLARAAPFVRDDLKRDEEPAARYRTLRRAFDQLPDPGVAHVLELLPIFAKRFDGALGVVGSGELPRLSALLHEHIERTARRLLAAVEAALEAGKSIRDHELKAVVAGARGTDFEETLKVVAAYKRAFGEAPALDATSLAGLYLDRQTSRVYFYVEGEDRWYRGAAHAASPGPVLKFLLEAKDPSLAQRATNPRAVALLYNAFGEVPFEAGFTRVEKLAQEVAARVALLEGQARKGGATDAQVDAFFARELGYDRSLAGPALGGGVAPQAVELFTRVVLDSGPEAGTALVSALETVKARALAIDVLAFTGMKVTATGAVPAEVELRLDGKLPRAPIVPLPERVAPGAPFGCVLALAARESLERVRLVAEARGPAGEAFTGELALPEAGARAAGGRVDGGALGLVPGWKLELEAGPEGAPVTAAVLPGEALHARLRPRGQARLVVRGPGDLVERGAWSPEGGLVVPLGLWRAGEWRVCAEDSSSRTIAEARFTLAAAPGLLCVDSGEVPLRAVLAGATVGARFVQSGSDVAPGKASVSLEHEDGGLAIPPVEGTAPLVSFKIPSSLAPGRYVLRAKLGDRALPAWPLAIAASKPRVAFVREPFAPDAIPVAGAGEKLYARIDPGFWLDPREVVSVSIGLRGPSGGAATILKAPSAWQSVPERRLLFPVTLPDSAPVGAWEAEVTVTTPRGKVSFKSPLRVASGEDLPFSLVTISEASATSGDRRTSPPRLAFSPGEQASVQLAGASAASIGSASFVLVGPDGLGHALEAARADDSKKQNGGSEETTPEAPTVTLAVPSTAALGKWELRGVLAGESTVKRRVLALEIYAPAPFKVSLKGHAGDDVSFDVPALDGLEPPLRVRVGSGKWLEQTKALTQRVEGTAVVPILVEDAKGRRAQGSLEIEATQETTPGETGAPDPSRPAAGGGPSFGVVANVRERSIFYPSFLSLSQALRSGKLDPDWVVIEQGPLTAAALRDLVFERVPYDGPKGTNPSSIYRSVRFWEHLTDPVKRRFQELGTNPATIFDVTDTPTPAAEETLAALVRRHVDARGGWVYELEHVGVRAQGAIADPTPPMIAKRARAELRFDSFSSSFEAHNVARLVSPGVLGELSLRVHFPEKLVLGEPFAIAATTAAVTTTLVAGRAYPGDLDQIAGRALLATYLEGSFELEGKERTLTIAPLPSFDAHHPGRELVFTAVPFQTDRDPLAAGKPRTAEHYRVKGLPLSKPPELDPPPVLTPVPPGTLENRARRVRVVIHARLAVAVTPGDWPAGRPRPDPEVVGGASFLVDPVDLPKTEIELEAFYSRVSPEGAPPRGTSAPALPDVVVTGAEPIKIAALDARPEVELAATALATGRADDAEAHARNAVLAEPTLAVAWTTLGEAMLQERRAEDALVALSHARELAPDSGRALVALAEVHLELGHSKEARAAARLAKARTLTPDEAERAAKVLGE